MLGFKKAGGAICVPRKCQPHMVFRPQFPSTTRIVPYIRVNNTYKRINLQQTKLYYGFFLVSSVIMKKETKKTGDSE